MSSNFDFRIFVVILWVKSVCSMSQASKHSYFMDSGASDSDFADFIISKGYLPSEQALPKPSVVENVETDATYVLSKLSDEDLIKLLNDQPKNVYDLKDIVNVAVDTKPVTENKLMLNLGQSKPRGDLDLFPIQSTKDKRFKTISQKDRPGTAFFRLENKPVDPFSMKSDADPNYAALQKINNLLYSRPLEEIQEKSAEDDEKKELLFDVLVSQLKTLCCKSTKSTKKRDEKKMQYKSVLNQLIPKTNIFKEDFKTPEIRLKNSPSNEHMFLIMNDEIKSNDSDELISVDPESLETNSSVLLLGPITTPLSNAQLKAVMARISKELSKSEYLPLLQQLSEGNLSGTNIKLMKNLINGPDARRYIKPHRCNYQSPLAKVYGGPKWLICTGYLNLNTPSLYDK